MWTFFDGKYKQKIGNELLFSKFYVMSTFNTDDKNDKCNFQEEEARKSSENLENRKSPISGLKIYSDWDNKIEDCKLQGDLSKIDRGYDRLNSDIQDYCAEMPESKLCELPDDEELALDLTEPSPEVMEYARWELGETEEVKCQTLDELREMIYERGECLPHRMDDAFLIRFLRARNFNVHRAHRLVTNYYNFKKEHPEIHVNVNPLKMKHIGDDDIMTVPSYRTQCGRRMMIYRMGNWDPRKYSVEEIFKATLIILELGILEPRAQVLGGVVIFDLEGITMSHAWTITPKIANMVLALMVLAFPMKTYAIHILHQSWVFDAIFAVFKPLLDSRMQDKIFFHGHDMESLHRHVSATYLPKKYGGTREELPYYKWIDALSKVPIIVKEMHQVGYVIPDELLNTIQN